MPPRLYLVLEELVAVLKELRPTEDRSPEYRAALDAAIAALEALNRFH